MTEYNLSLRFLGTDSIMHKEIVQTLYSNVVVLVIVSLLHNISSICHAIINYLCIKSGLHA